MIAQINLLYVPKLRSITTQTILVSRLRIHALKIKNMLKVTILA